jgi:signal transduction histidine kinase
MTGKKTSTGLRIGISVSMVIMMLGLAIVLNVFTTYAITNQTKILSDLNIPISQGISQLYSIQQMQYQSYEDAITYQKLDSPKNYEFSKNQFNSHNKEFDYQIIKIKDLANAYLDSGLDENLNADLGNFINILDEIKKLHLQYANNADQIFKLQDNPHMGNMGSLMTLFETEYGQINSKTSLLNDQVHKITDNLEVRVEQSKQKSLTFQAIIIISAGIISIALCYFLNLINKDIIQEVVRKTMSLQKVNRKLEKMNVLKEDFINIASHELMSPLQPLYGYVELAQNGDIGKDEALVGISKQAKQLEEVANRILYTGRINYGRQPPTFEKFNFSNLLMETISSYGLSLNEKVRIKTDFEEGIEIEADRIGIGQVIRN